MTIKKKIIEIIDKDGNVNSEQIFCMIRKSFESFMDKLYSKEFKRKNRFRKKQTKQIYEESIRKFMGRY